MAAEEFPFDINPMYEGERVRKGDMYVELGGTEKPGLELVYSAEMDEVEDGKFTLIGPDLQDMKEGSQVPYAMIYKIAGSQVEKDLEGIVERRNHDFQNFIQGYMHLNQRYDIWVRISKDAVKKGLTSLEPVAKATMKLFKAELPFIEKMEAIYITDPDEVDKKLAEAMEIYNWRDARTRDLHDEDVDTFYSCTLCQSFAPTNVCVVTPDRVSLCGAINWFDGRAAAKVDPEGPNAPIPKGDVIDEIGGEYSGVNDKAVDSSGGEYDRIKIHSFFEYPHTSCGCFEVIGFYMPEIDGIGWVNREYTELTPNGLPFSTMAGQTGGGKQTIGFLGIGVDYFRSPKFIQSDGGWKRTVWMPSKLKERVQDSIPDGVLVATEEDAANIDELREFLQKNDHPVVTGVVRDVDGAKITEGWVEEVEEAVVESTAPVPATTGAATPTVSFGAMPQFSMPAMGGGSGGVKLVLKNAKVSVEKIMIKKKED
ncbi:MAG: CO dehydrogenase/CO-methylating acetyl-CoA synthase complex subunit beta [Halobacteriota archaeon]|nr:CO dehydrogenase/CO-methylating acetyl-CoA synthase complex subunit beta [Halobacteriota archaeon]